MTKRYVGFYRDEALPFGPGSTVVIPKGVLVKSMHPSRREFVTKRKMTVKVNHVLNGQSMPYYGIGDRERWAWRDNAAVVELLAKLDDENNVMRHYDGEDANERHLALHKATVPVHNPVVVWPGSGGYWNEVDINDILEANGVQDAA